MRHQTPVGAVAGVQPHPPTQPIANRDRSPILNVDRAEAEMLRLPRIEYPVVHHFGPGIYIHELNATAGTHALGRHVTAEASHLMTHIAGKRRLHVGCAL